MNDKRRDNKGRILNTGENQRKDGSYQYRYIDYSNKRQYIYAPTLKELRDKEKEIQKQLDDGIDYSAGKIKVAELINRHIALKQGVRQNTKNGYEYMLKNHIESRLFQMQIGNVKVSDVKNWAIQSQKAGYAYSTIAHVKSILNQAFQMAYEEDIIRKNPCNFKLSSVISSNPKDRFAMTEEQQKLWLDFIKNDPTYAKFYDQYVILLGTGLRISEFCGLTYRDLDFANRRIKIDHQLLQINKQGYKIERTKTEKGVRYIPMTDAVFAGFQNILNNRRQNKQEIVVDGYSDFVFLTKDGNPESKNSMERRTRRILAKYNKLHDQPLPNITPHIFRHTFCSNMANAGMNVNYLKYIMGHSKVTTTLDVYTHSDYEEAARQMMQIAN